MLALLRTSGPWWRGSKALNATETNHVKGHIGNTTTGETWNGGNRASRRNEIRLQKDYTSDSLAARIMVRHASLVPEAHPGCYVFFCLHHCSLLFALCFQAGKNGLIESCFLFLLATLLFTSCFQADEDGIIGLL
jgi:hypothetical protein